MTVKIVAKRTVNFGCIEGDWRMIKKVQSIEDRGDCWEIIINKNWSIFANKEDWKVKREHA